MPDPTLYLFDGFNLLHAAEFGDVRELTDVLASFVAMQGARGVVVFDGVGDDAVLGPLQIRYASHADTLLERLAAEHRESERVCLISSDAAVRGTAGQQVRKLSSRHSCAISPCPSTGSSAVAGGGQSGRRDSRQARALRRGQSS